MAGAEKLRHQLRAGRGHRHRAYGRVPGAGHHRRQDRDGDRAFGRLPQPPPRQGRGVVRRLHRDHRPVRGIMSTNFNPDKKHFGVDLTASPNENILAVLDGTVIAAFYTADWGYVIEVQHTQNFVSIYKQCGTLMKAEGDRVKGGDVIALVEAKTTNDDVQPHLHFELWHRGTPMNPEKYIVF